MDPEIEVWTWFSLLNIRHPQKFFKPVSQPLAVRKLKNHRMFGHCGEGRGHRGLRRFLRRGPRWKRQLQGASAWPINSSMFRKPILAISTRTFRGCEPNGLKPWVGRGPPPAQPANSHHQNLCHIFRLWDPNLNRLKNATGLHPGVGQPPSYSPWWFKKIWSTFFGSIQSIFRLVESVWTARWR